MSVMLVSAGMRRALAGAVIVLIQHVSQLIAGRGQVVDAFDDAYVAASLAVSVLPSVVTRVDAKDALFDHSTHRERLAWFVLDHDVSRRFDRFRRRRLLQEDGTLELLVRQPFFEDHRARLRRRRGQAFDDDLTRLWRRGREAFLDHVRSKRANEGHREDMGLYIAAASVYSSRGGGLGGRSRMVNGGGVRASGLRSRISRG